MPGVFEKTHRLDKTRQRINRHPRFICLPLQFNDAFSGYFEHGRDIGDSNVLAEIAAEIGLDSAQALAFLNSDADALQTRQAIAQVVDIQGVSNFDIDGEIISVSIIQNALQDAAARKRGQQD